MRKLYLFLFTGFFLLSLQVKSQAPNLLNYQGVARDASGIVLPNQAISLRFTIHQGTATGTTVYQETQSVTTNLLGLFTVSIGSGTVTAGTFSTIAWGANAEYLQVEMDPTGGTSYLNMGTSQFLSVPYALNAGTSTSGWNLTGNGSTNPASNFIGTTDATDFAIRTGGTEKMRVSNAGNVGVGTTTPGYNTQGANERTLTITGATGAAVELVKNVTAGIVGEGEISWVNTANSAPVANQGVAYIQALSPLGSNPGNWGADIQFATKQTGTSTIAAERMRITNTGNVGIGTGSPVNKLDVLGSAVIGSGFAGASTGPTNGLATSGNIGVGTVTTGYNTQGAGEQAVTIAGATGAVLELVKAAPAGPVGCGEISWVNTSNSAPVANQGIAYIQALSPAGSNTGNFGASIQFATKLNGSSGIATEKMRLTDAGNLGVGSTNPLQKLEIGGITNTIRDDGLATGGSFIITPSATTDKVLFANASGDVQAITPGTSGSVLTLASGVPTWAPASSSGWNLTGNSGTTAGTNFIGTIGTQDLVFKTNSSENMRIANSTGNVGIGTNNPGQPLDVGGNVQFSKALMPNTDPGVSGEVLESQGPNHFPVWTTITALAGGGDGWGTQTAVNDSVATLGVSNTINGNGTAPHPLKLAQNGATSGQVLTWNGSTWAPAAAATSGWGLTGNGGTTAGTNFIGTTDPTDFVVKTAGAERMRVSSSGNVGVANSTPGYQIQGVTGETAFTIGGASGAALELAKNSSGVVGGGEIDWVNTSNTSGNQGIAYIQTVTLGAAGNNGAAIQFATKTNGTTGVAQERMRIADVGNVGVGTTTPGYNTQGANERTVTIGGTNGAALELVRSVAAGPVGCGEISWVNPSNSAPVGNQGIAYIQAVSSSGTNSGTFGATLQFATKANGTSGIATEKMRITEAGKVGIGSTSPGTLTGTVGMLELKGTPGGTSAPVIQEFGSDNFPINQQLWWNHDNMAISFDAYFDNASWKSSSALSGGSVYQIYKLSGQLLFNYATGTTAGSTIAGGFSTGMTLNGNGSIGIGISTTAPKNKLDIGGSVVIGSYAGASAGPANGLAVSGNAGIGTNTPNSTLQVNGSIATAVVSKTSTYTLAITDAIVFADATSAGFTITLPTAVGITGRHYTIKKTDVSANAITVGTTSSQTIDGVATFSLPAQWKYITIVSDGANWMIIANN